jgi:hypothetical protein
LLSRVWYLNLHSFWSFSSIVVCMCGHRFVHPPQEGNRPTKVTHRCSATRIQ